MTSYLVIGHITLDRFPDGDRPGGTALYSAVEAAHSGAETRIVTATSVECLDLAASRLRGVEVHNRVTPSPTTFAYECTDGVRIQRLTHVAPAVEAADIPQAWLDSDIWHLAPVADEVSLRLHKVIPRTAFIGITPQGWMRRVDRAGMVRQRSWSPPAELLARTSAIVFSDEDAPDADVSARNWSEQGPVVVVTKGAEGSTLYVDGGAGRRVPAVRVEPVSDIGAGDAFATALFLQLAAGADPFTAVTTASRRTAEVISVQASHSGG